MPAPRLLGGRYLLEERLGEGGLGVVWRARHLGLQRDVALKLLRAAPYDPEALARFQREAEALGRLRHPHVVEVTDFGVDADTGVPYLVMELLASRTLADLLREEGRLPTSRALPLLEALADAVDAAHAQGILHRDLKPGNISMAGVKVLDFGLAEIVQEAPAGTPMSHGAIGEERLTSTGSLLGTPLYAAPEVIREGTACRASDIYSLGVIAYEMLTGRPPFTGATAEVLAGHLQREPPVPDLAAPVWEALRGALRKDPDDRPATATGFVRQLRRAVEQSAEAARRKAELPRRVLLSAAVAAGSLAIGLLLPPAGLPSIERRLDDLRIEMVRKMASLRPDPRILLVIFDKKSQRESDVPLAGRAEEIGGTLSRILDAGARGVAVDLVLPDQWRQSPAFADLVLRHPRRLTLAALSDPDDGVGGTGCVSGLITAALGAQQAAGLFGFVNLDEDPGRLIRTGRLSFHNEPEGVTPSWAARAAADLGAVPRLPAGTAFRIDHRINSHAYPRLPWRDLPAVLIERPQFFRGRLVLVGIDLPDAVDDSYEIPVSLGGNGAVSGLAVQALQIDTILAGLPIRTAGRLPALLLAALLAGGAALMILHNGHPGRAALGLSICAALYAVFSFLVFERTGSLLPVTAPCLVAALGLAAGQVLRRLLPGSSTP